MNTVATSIPKLNPRAQVRRVNYTKLLLALLVAALIASSWLVFPYFVHGKQLLRNVGDNARLSKGGHVSRYLTRELVNHPELLLTATFATDEFFQFVDRATVVSNLRPDKNLVFFVSENIHEGRLSLTLPEVSLHVGDAVYQPTVSVGPRVAEHHRVTVYSFPKRTSSGATVDFEQAANIRLHVANHYFDSSRKLTFVGLWEAPYRLPDELKSRADITPIAAMALGAGLLSSVLTPCLLQLLVVFGSIIGGFANVPGTTLTDTATLAPIVKRKIRQLAGIFVLGFTSLYVMAGALIGAVGHQAQLVFAEYSRSVTIASGILVILMGAWVGLRGTRDYACRLPDRRVVKSLAIADNTSTLLISMGYALGCTACFGGAIVATLIVYVGAIGSAAIGAGVMLAFSIGVAIPFLASAYFLSKVDSVSLFFAKHALAISRLSMVLIITFGLILVTDNFHVVSDLIYPYLGLR